MRGRVLVAIAGASLAATAWQGFAARAAHAQTADPGFDFEINHVGISVPNLDESIAWYRRMLGFELVRRVEQNPSMSIALLRHGDFNIELFQIAEAKPLPDYRRDPSADLRVHGLAHFAFRVDDARAAAAELEAKGAEIVFGPVENERSIFFFVSDNAGNAFELIQPKS